MLREHIGESRVVTVIGLCKNAGKTSALRRLMAELDYGKGYVYAHDTAEKMADMDCLPESLQGRRYYQPTGAGSEARAKENLERILAWKDEMRAGRK